MFASRWSRVALPVALVLLARDVRAADPERAETLFQEARSLIAQKRYDEACARLAESEALDPGIGTQFNLARCYELGGHLARAREVYDEVANETHAAGQTAREQVARARIEALSRHLGRLHLVLAEGGDVSGLAIQVDESPLPRESWERSPFVDAGHHVVRATFPGRAPFESAVDVPEGRTVDVAIPAPLVRPEPQTSVTPALPGVPPVAVEVRTSSPSSPRRTAAYVTGGVGLAAVATGLGFGFYSWVRKRDSSPECIGDVCNAAGVSARRDAVVAGNVSTALVVGGSVVTAVGVVLLATAPGRHGVAVRGAPMLAADRGGLLLRAEW